MRVLRSIVGTLAILAAFFTQAQAQLTVAVFDDPAFVDSNNSNISESDTVQASLVMLGHTVTTFTGIAAADFQGAIDDSDCLLIPELELGDLGAALSQPSRRPPRRHSRTTSRPEEASSSWVLPTSSISPLRPS